MFLPPGTLRALKGNHDGIVAVVCLAMTFAAIRLGVDAWVAVVVLALVLGMFHIRGSSREGHQHRMAILGVEKAALNVEEIKARYRELVLAGQPALPLERRHRRLTEDKDR